MNVLIIIVIIYFVYKVLEAIFKGASTVVSHTAKTVTETKIRNSVDSSITVTERNEDIILEHLDKIRDDSWPHYVENMVRDCIGDIANKEGYSDLAPKHREWLSVWEKRSDIPQEYLDLKDYLKELFKARFDREKSIAKQKYDDFQRMEQEKTAEAGNIVLQRNKDLVDKFIDIAERKVSIIDDYGDENWEILPNEITACLKKISQREEADIDWSKYEKEKRSKYSYFSLPDEYEWLEKKLEEIFREHHKIRKGIDVSTENLNDFSGVEFETWIAKLLKEMGVDDVRGTPVTGDQGADLIAKHNGKTIIIQAKRYLGNVGNKAVQEVASAVSFYNGDEGWVITNSRFTPSAKALAHKTNIKLIDGSDLKNRAFL